jgi:hypothetical protein
MLVLLPWSQRHQPRARSVLRVEWPHASRPQALSKGKANEALMEVPGSPRFQCALMEDPGSPRFQCALMEVPGSPRFQCALMEVPGSPRFQCALMEDPGSPRFQCALMEDPGSPHLHPDCSMRHAQPAHLPGALRQRPRLHDARGEVSNPLQARRHRRLQRPVRGRARLLGGGARGPGGDVWRGGGEACAGGEQRRVFERNAGLRGADRGGAREDAAPLLGGGGGGRDVGACEARSKAEETRSEGESQQGVKARCRHRAGKDGGGMARSMVWVKGTEASRACD